MTIQFACPTCSTRYTVGDQDAGRKGECKVCRQRFQVPAASPARNPRPGRPAARPAQTRPRPVGLIVGLASGGAALVVGGILLLVLVAVRGRGPADPVVAARPPAPDAPAVAVPAALPPVQPAPEEPPPAPEPERAAPRSKGAAPEGPAPLPLTGEQVYRRLVRCSALIESPAGLGTGFIVDADKRLLVTNQHVVGGQARVTLIFPMYDREEELVTDAREYRRRAKEIGVRAEVLARDEQRDLALVRAAELPERADVVPLAGRPAATGSGVYSVGNSGVGDNLLWRLTKGTVRGRVRQQKALSDSSNKVVLRIDCMILETDAPVNPGDSGGAVMNDRGDLVAVVSNGSVAQRQVSGNIDVEEVREFLSRHSDR